MHYFEAFFDTKELITILKAIPLGKDIQTIILDKLIEEIIREEMQPFHFSIHSYEDNDGPYYLDVDDFFEFH